MKPVSAQILFLDRVQVGDMLFLQALAATYHRRTSSRSDLIVHGAGEPAERLLESRGFIPMRKGDVLLAETPTEQALVERATREAGRRIAGVLTDASISAVAISGSDRRMLSVRQDRSVYAARVEWLLEMAERDVLPVLALLGCSEGASTPTELDPAAAIIGLIDALGRDFCAVTAVVADTRTGSPADLVRERAALERIASDGIDVRLGELRSLSDDSDAGWLPLHD